MPRDASGIYHTYNGTDGVTNQTIYSAPYNLNVHDIEQDLNTPRPIVAGGTGATDAAGARANLQVAVAMVKVTNYDTQVWENGSFWSAPGTTGAPNANAFVGTALIANNDPNYATITARDINDPLYPSVLWVREKNGGAWGPWTTSINTPNLTLAPASSGANAVISLQKPAGAYSNYIAGSTGTSLRWLMQLGDNGPESGGNSGSNFQLNRCDDSGNVIGVPLAITRSNGQVALASTVASTSPTTGALTVAGGLGVGGAIHVGSVTLEGPSITLRLSNDGRTIMQEGSGNTYYDNSVHIFRSSGGGVQYGIWNNTSLAVLNTTASTSPTTGALTVAGGVGINGAIFTPGMVAQPTGNLTANLQGYKPGGGPWADSSDARIKTVQDDYIRGMNKVRELHPVHFTYRGNDTPGHPPEGETAPYSTSSHYQVAKSGQIFAGLIAQEVEAIFPECVTKTTGYIDGVFERDVRTLDTGPLIYALINAVKELDYRLAQLEAATPTEAAALKDLRARIAALETAAI